MNPPSIVNNSDDANFPLYISWSERMIINSRIEYNIELPVPAMAFKMPKRKQTIIASNIYWLRTTLRRRMINHSNPIHNTQTTTRKNKLERRSGERYQSTDSHCLFD